MEQKVEKNVALETAVEEQAVALTAPEVVAVEKQERKLVLNKVESEDLLANGSTYITRETKVTMLIEKTDGGYDVTHVNEYDKVVVKQPAPKKVLKGVAELQEGDLVAIGNGKIYKVQANEADKLTAKAPGAKTAIEIDHSQVIQFIQVSPRA